MHIVRTPVYAYLTSLNSTLLEDRKIPSCITSQIIDIAVFYRFSLLHYDHIHSTKEEREEVEATNPCFE